MAVLTTSLSNLWNISASKLTKHKITKKYYRLLQFLIKWPVSLELDGKEPAILVSVKPLYIRILDQSELHISLCI